MVQNSAKVRLVGEFVEFAARTQFIVAALELKLGHSLVLRTLFLANVLCAKNGRDGRAHL
jgi:hypothetical protein